MSGDCYEANGRHLLNQGSVDKASGYVLVHGVAILQTDGKPFGHCWIEKSNTVYDYSNGKNINMPKKVFYSLGQIPAKGYKNYAYKFKDLRKQVFKYEHWGPWDSKPPR